MKFTEFVSTQRKKIFSYCVGTTLITFTLSILPLPPPTDSSVPTLLSFIAKSPEVFSSFLVNLSATALTTGIAIIYIDYLLNVEKISSVKEGHTLALSEFERIFREVGEQIAALYGFSYQLSKDDIKGDILSIAIKQRHDFLKNLQEHDGEKRMLKNKMSSTVKELDAILLEFNTLISSFGYSLSSNERTKLLKYRREINNVRVALDWFTKNQHEGSIESDSRIMLSLIRSLNILEVKLS